MSLMIRVKELANQRKLTISELERKLDFGNGTISRWSVNTPGVDKIQKVADYFDVSADYLLGRTDNPNSNTSTIPTDLDKILDSMMSFDGKPMTDHDRETIRAYLEGKFSNK